MSSVDATEERWVAQASRQVDLDGLEEVGLASQRLLSRRPQYVAEDYEQFCRVRPSVFFWHSGVSDAAWA